MKEQYFPLWAKGEIMVYFEEGVSEGFAKDFGSALGYEFIPSDGPWYLFKTEVGKEKETMNEFLSYKKFVNGVERRDLRLEKRFNFIDGLIWKTKNLDKFYTSSEKEFLEGLNEIRKEIEDYKDLP
ncbi:MAG: hypothetical protein KC516_01825 [Nanoarchaeota archaeon]|nr:hypothetical protein [Nanoarchaeota archaeon]